MFSGFIVFTPWWRSSMEAFAFEFAPEESYNPLNYIETCNWGPLSANFCITCTAEFLIRWGLFLFLDITIQHCLRVSTTDLKQYICTYTFFLKTQGCINHNFCKGQMTSYNGRSSLTGHYTDNHITVLCFLVAVTFTATTSVLTPSHSPSFYPKWTSYFKDC